MDGVEGSANGSPRIQNIIDEDDGAPIDSLCRDIGWLERSNFP